MNDQKTAYLNRIRQTTSYAELRGIAKISEIVLRIFGLLIAALGLLSLIGGAFGALAGNVGGVAFFTSGLLSAFIGSILVLLSLIIKTGLSAIADIADSITDLNCRYEAGE